MNNEAFLQVCFVTYITPVSMEYRTVRFALAICHSGILNDRRPWVDSDCDLVKNITNLNDRFRELDF